MKRIMLLVPVLLFSMLFAVVPALAQPANMVPVKVTATPSPTGNVQGTYLVTNGGILQLRDAVSAGTLKLYITSMVTPDYMLTGSNEFLGIVNMGREIPFPGPWPEAKGEWHSNVVWSYIVSGQVLGKFEGIWTETSIGWYTAPIGHIGSEEGHAVLEGSGTFDGMTLILDSTGPPTIFTGYLLMH